MTSVERVLEYSNIESEIENNVENESSSMIADKMITVSNIEWPTHGSIEFKNISLRYGNNMFYALKNFNLKCQPGMKIGIVGRTGAGKSSIIQTLFRLVDFDGDIEIDTINTKTIDVHELRKKISVIPQNPILFSGTIRKNLDPHFEKSDDDLWQALEKVKINYFHHIFVYRLIASVHSGQLNIEH